MNQSILDYFSSFLSWPGYYINTIFRYKKTYKNFFHVFLNSFRNNFPITGILKNGDTIILKSRFDSGAVTNNFQNYFFWNDDVLHVTNPNLSELKFVGADKNGDIQAVFFDEVYGELDVKDKIVVDIGANIGDTAIYFASKGAQVYALEIDERRYKIIQEHLKINPDLAKRIIPINAAFGSEGEVEFYSDPLDFMDPSIFKERYEEHIEKAIMMNVPVIEIHTGHYANLKDNKFKLEELTNIKNAVNFSHEAGLVINAGHGLHYNNVKEIVKIYLSFCFLTNVTLNLPLENPTITTPVITKKIPVN